VGMATRKKPGRRSFRYWARAAFSAAWPALLVPICLGSETPHEADAGEGVVIVASTFPSMAHRDFQSALARIPGGDGEQPPLRVAGLITMGDAEETSRSLSAACQSRPLRACIFLDSRSARMLNHLTCPMVALTPSASILDELATTTRTHPHITVVETRSRASDLIEALARFTPRPTTIGIVHTESAPGNDAFMKSLRNHAERESWSPEKLVECGISAAGCRNVQATRKAIAQAFADLPANAPLVVLPGQNALKFAFVFRSYAAERSLALIGVDAFPSQSTVCHLAIPPENLARYCYGLLTRPDAKSPSPPPPASVIRFDAEKAQALGYTIRRADTQPR